MDKSKHFKCEDCGLHYEIEKFAKDCYEFCVANNACNVEITKNSIEAKQVSIKPKQ